MATELITAFNGGEASRNLESRKDLDFYKRLCSIAENVDILSEGGAITRAGSKYIADTKSDGKAYVREFSYSDTYAYVMEMGEGYIRIYDNQSESVVEDITTAPWGIDDIPELCFYRSYDVMWIVHKDHPVQILTRTAVDAFSLAEMEFDYPPLLEQNITDTQMKVSHTTGNSRTLTADAAYFDTSSPSEHIGAIFAINHERTAAQLSVNDVNKTASFQSGWLDVSFCNWRVETGGKWNGLIIVERRYNQDDSTIEAGEKVCDTTGIEEGNFSFDSSVREGGSTEIRINYTYSAHTDGLDYNISCSDLYTYGLVEVTAVASSTSATCDVISAIGVADEYTARWSEGAFSDLRGYPRTVSRHEDRLVFSGTNYEPNMQWFSFTGDYYNFYAGTLDDEAIRRAPPVNGFSSWMVSKGDLFTGTDKELLTVLGYNPNQPITPENFKYNVESSFGGAYRQPVLANNVVLYLQKNEQTIREILYDDNSKSYRSQDLSRIAKHITGNGVEEITLMRLPEQRLHCVLGNGEKGVLTYERTEEVVAWRRYVTDGDYISTCVVDNGAEDAVWNVVLRNGQYMIEKEMSRAFVGSDYWCLDSALNTYLTTPSTITGIALDGDDVVVTSVAHGLEDGEYVRIVDVAGMTEVNEGAYEVSDEAADTFKLKFEDGSAYIDGSEWSAYTSGGTATEVTNTIDGLDHLEGLTVGVTGDGMYDGTHVVESGSVTLNDYYNRLVAGLLFESTVSPMPIEPDLMDRASSGKQKLVSGKVKLKLKDTIGGSFGSILSETENIIGETAPNMGVASALINDDVEVYHADGWDDIKRVYFKQTLPFPAEILSMVITLDVRS